MDTWDHSAKRYQNDEEYFYIPEKRARIGALSHAYRWKHNELEGVCRQETERQQSRHDDQQNRTGSVFQPALVDEVLLTDNASVFFDTDSAELRPLARQILNQFASRITAYEDVINIQLEGHTDSRASDEYNQDLSQRRNESVKDYLRSNLKISHDIVLLHFGEQSPASPNSTPEGMQRNRRVIATVRAMGVVADNTNPSICYPLPDFVATSKNIPYSSGAKNSVAGQVVPPNGLPLSGGDQVNVTVSADDTFAGVYEVTMNGELVFPLIGALKVSGKTPAQVEASLSKKLVENEIVQPYVANVDMAVKQWAPVEVFVRGAVFNEGRVTINVRSAEFSALSQLTRSGDYSGERLLSRALRMAGGLRPDANTSEIILMRDGNRSTYNFSGLFDGRKVNDVALISGDEIIVPTTGHYQGKLVRPTSITPADMIVYMSNPTVPILNNTSAAIDANGTKLPYGVRFLRALVSANCVGGVQNTNAGRRGVLISTNPLTGTTEVIERSVQQLVSNPDRDDINPHLMPNDGVACYDSSVSNIRDVARTLTEVLAPFKDIRELFKIP